MNSIQKTARLAGFLYLLIALLATFSILYISSMFIVPGDAATTASNILASDGLFRLGIVSDSVVILFEIVLIAILYVLLRPVNKTLALVVTFARLAMNVVMAVNVFNSLSVRWRLIRKTALKPRVSRPPRRGQVDGHSPTRP